MNSRNSQRLLAAAAGLAVSTAAHAQYGFVTNIPGTFTDISTTGTALLTAVNDDGTVTFVSPVTNALVTTGNLAVSVNGWINNRAGDASYSNQSLPFAGGGSVFLCPYWDDLYLNTTVPAGMVVHQTVVESGVNIEIIEWVNARLFASSAGPSGNFEVKIFGAGGAAYVQYLYQGMAWAGNGVSATVGIQWGTAAASQYNFNSSTSPGIPNNAVLSIVQVPTGACCLSTSGCVQADASTCASQGGTYAGDGVACSAINCPSGACCLPDLSCSILSPSGCASQGGTYRGDASLCANANCPSPGACCHVDGTCTQTSGPTCTSSGGTYHGDNTPCGTANCPGPTLGPDVIVGEVFDVGYDGAVGNITAYSVGTDSCNLGDVGVTWVQGNNQHPVISGNIFRLKTVAGAGRFEQLGLSWYKHGFSATNSSFCGTCHTFDGTHLGPGGCSDVYSSGLNGSQGNMGPRSELNATTGVFPYPSINQGNDPSVIGKRCQVFTADIDPAQNAGALYFADAHYVVPDDAQYSHNGANATNGLNNYSYRQILIASTSSTPTFVSGSAGLTREQVPGIQAWRDHDAGVTLTNAEYIDSTVGPNIVARFIVGAKATSLGGGMYHYEYAVYNVNADRSGGSFSVPVPAGVQVSNVGFHAPFYHSGEVYDNTAWDSSVSGGAVTWTPHPFNPAANANAVRWGTMYNFRFDANVAPGVGNVTLGLFKTGNPGSLTVAGMPIPGIACYANCDSSTTAPILNVADFTCFLQAYANQDPYANCDGSTAVPVLNVGDFTCFLQKYAAGCP